MKPRLLDRFFQALAFSLSLRLRIAELPGGGGAGGPAVAAPLLEPKPDPLDFAETAAERDLRAQFGLPDAEVLLKRFSQCHLRGAVKDDAGALYLTQSHLLFVGRALAGLVSRREDLPLSQVTQVGRTRETLVQVHTTRKKYAFKFRHAAQADEFHGFLSCLWARATRATSPSTSASPSPLAQLPDASSASPGSLGRRRAAARDAARFEQVCAHSVAAASRRMVLDAEGPAALLAPGPQLPSGPLRRPSPGLTEEDWAQLERGGRLVRLQRNDQILEEGQLGAKFYKILRGRCRVERQGLVLGFLYEQDTFGEMALLAPLPAVASVLADEDDVLLLEFDAVFLLTLLELHPGLQGHLFHYVCSRCVLDLVLFPSPSPPPSPPPLVPLTLAACSRF
jgi:hypothetical protein